MLTQNSIQAEVFEERPMRKPEYITKHSPLVFCKKRRLPKNRNRNRIPLCLHARRYGIMPTLDEWEERYFSVPYKIKYSFLFSLVLWYSYSPLFAKANKIKMERYEAREKEIADRASRLVERWSKMPEFGARLREQPNDK